MKRALALLVTLLMLSALAAGCSGGTSVIQLQLHEVTHSIFYAPQYVAINLGYFKEEGLEIVLTNAGGADKAMTALLAGQADIAFMGPESSVYVYNEGREDYTVIVGQVTERDGAFLIAREDLKDFTWDMVRGKIVIGGRKGGIPLMTLMYMLEAQGIKPGVDVDVRDDVQFNLMGGAFAGGEGDFVTLFEPAASAFVQEGKGYLVASVGEAAGEVPYTAYQVKQSYLKKNGATVEKFLRALYKGQQYVDTHSDKEVAAAIKPSFPDTDDAMLEQVVARYRGISAWKKTPVMEEKAFTRLQDILESAGELKARVPFDKIVDNTLALKVSK